jgi:DNA-binding NarL/FixJ family response regulator
MSKAENTRLMVVDDEESILDLFEGIFDNQNESNKFTYELSCCRQGEEAVERVRNSLIEKDHYSVVFLDVSLPPGKNGFWTAEKICAIDPEVNIVIISGGDSSDHQTSSFNAEFAPSNRLLHINKPFDPQEIKQLADLLVTSWLDKKKTDGALKELGAKMLESEIKELADSLSSNLFDMSKKESSDDFLYSYQLKIAELKQSLQRQLREDNGATLLFGEVIGSDGNKKNNYQIHLDRSKPEDSERSGSDPNRQLLANILELTEPYLEKLLDSGLKKDQREYVSIIRQNLSEIGGPAMGALTQDPHKFTNSEMKTINLIKHGKTSKEIAEIFNISRRTVEFHRNSIRKKLNIDGSKVKLRSYLRNLEL